VKTTSKQSLPILFASFARERSGKGLARQRGQGMTEYIIIVALVAVAAIGWYQNFGQRIRSTEPYLILPGAKSVCEMLPVSEDHCRVLSESLSRSLS
jgi:hypothetical protein